jgi:hypothetical protein
MSPKAAFSRQKAMARRIKPRMLPEMRTPKMRIAAV